MAVERVGRVDLIREHGADTRSLFLALDAPLSFRPGQFLSCLLPVGGERIIRPYSIASGPDEPERLEILYNLVSDGPGSGHLHTLQVGDALHFTGPWGTFVLDEPPDAETVFVAEHTAIAPIRAMLRWHAVRPHRPFRLLYGTAVGVYLDELTALPGLETEVVRPDRLLDETRRRFVDADAARSRHFFVCAIGATAYALRDCLRGAGYPRHAVRYEKW
jgi:ferredoxin-NADP reductase